MVYNEGDDHKVNGTQPQSSSILGENVGGIYSTWNVGVIYLAKVSYLSVISGIETSRY
jgi:hypothetical protein